MRAAASSGMSRSACSPGERTSDTAPAGPSAAFTTRRTGPDGTSESSYRSPTNSRWIPSPRLAPSAGGISTTSVKPRRSAPSAGRTRPGGGGGLQLGRGRPRLRSDFHRRGHPAPLRGDEHHPGGGRPLDPGPSLVVREGPDEVSSSAEGHRGPARRCPTGLPDIDVEATRVVLRWQARVPRVPSPRPRSGREPARSCRPALIASGERAAPRREACAEATVVPDLDPVPSRQPDHPLPGRHVHEHRQSRCARPGEPDLALHVPVAGRTKSATERSRPRPGRPSVACPRRGAGWPARRPPVPPPARGARYRPSGPAIASAGTDPSAPPHILPPRTARRPRAPLPRPGRALDGPDALQLEVDLEPLAGKDDEPAARGCRVAGGDDLQVIFRRGDRTDLEGTGGGREGPGHLPALPDGESITWARGDGAPFASATRPTTRRRAAANDDPLHGGARGDRDGLDEGARGTTQDGGDPVAARLHLGCEPAQRSGGHGEQLGTSGEEHLGARGRTAVGEDDASLDHSRASQQDLERRLPGNGDLAKRRARVSGRLGDETVGARRETAQGEPPLPVRHGPEPLLGGGRWTTTRATTPSRARGWRAAPARRGTSTRRGR